MLVRFYTYEEACIFSSMKRAEGCFAEVIHDNFGHFYGHMAANGFAVILSEEAAPEGMTVPQPEGPVAPLSEIGKMVAMLGLLGMLGGVAFILFVCAMMVMGFMATPVKIQIYFFIYIAFTFFSLLFMLKLTRVYNRPKHSFYGLSRFVIKSIAWVFIISNEFLVVIFTIWYLAFGI